MRVLSHSMNKICVDNEKALLVVWNSPDLLARHIS